MPGPEVCYFLLLKIQGKVLTALTVCTGKGQRRCALAAIQSASGGLRHAAAIRQAANSVGSRRRALADTLRHGEPGPFHIFLWSLVSR